MRKIAFLFPGQGSQSIGMGHEFYQEYDIVREIFDMAEEITRMNLSKLCFKGPMEELTETVNLQPAVTAVNLACLAAIEKEGIKANFCAGHSLGEYSALCSAGVVSKEETIKLVFKRGKLMHREATQHAGAMQAIVGFSIEEVEELVAEVQQDGVLSVANHNTEKQIVITGSPQAVNRAAALAAEKGAKAIPLKVSGAWHSKLIKGAEDEFANYLSEFSFNSPKSAIIFNVTANTEEEPGNIKSIMARQLCSPVKWYDSMNKLIEENVEIFIEVGPGRVLNGILKKILPGDYGGQIYNVSNMEQLERFLNDVS
ncbi:MAG: ACP S-malonyltransferase [Desulfobacterales bacterium]|nr:MAG: ACP S-malonyltransferase [Desulfobacterales bacterium]